ncbi:hypothetical protein SCE1572_25240 [Sorangium cellulosum So0157-2]|uniref:Uncharacterized protein n=1 Tax=Sorangium cellulosum So0157-2 TaxID=1254432 RepID=S4XYG6_SORCE|nr:hypothetical protein SCE1572_25240 [Sorangium cellulosum So0157-2]
MIAGSAERTTSTLLPWLGVVPWLQTVTEALNALPGTRLGGPLTAETTRSGRWPTPRGALDAALLASFSSSCASFGSTIAPR